MNQPSEYRVGVGASSILMIFIVLCLTTLGVLSFVSAKANLSLTDRRTQQVTAYYESNARADALIAEIDAIISEARKDADSFEETLADRLNNLDDVVSFKDSVVSLRLPVGTTQALNIDLQVLAQDAALRYSVIRHETVNTVDFQPDNSIKLLTEDPNL